VNGFCPSFVTVEGGKLKKPAKLKIEGEANLDVSKLPQPILPSTAQAYGVIVTGVGGTGVVTIGQIMAMAAHLQGKACSVLDMTGLAQKGGAVMSHVRLADHKEQLQSTRVGTGMADLVIGCDMIVTAGKEAVSRMGEGRTRVAINADSSPTSAFIKNPNWQFPAGSAEAEIRKACGESNVDIVDASAIAVKLMGDTIAANMFMLGYAWQKAWVPLTQAALMRAIELNGVAIEFNKQAFNWGRVAAHDMAALKKMVMPAQVISFTRAASLDDIIKKRVDFLTEYQDAAYAEQYRSFVAQVQAREAQIVDGKPLRLSEAVAKYLFKLMAYKDEYEVARLYTNGKFQEKIADMFEGDYSINFHLAPPLFAKRDAQGHLVKQKFGPWMMKAFGLLAKMKSLRGGSLDIFGRTEERKMERALIVEYRQLLSEILPQLNADNLAKAVALASIPEDIRGYGHVKERHFAAAKTKQAQLLLEFKMPKQNAA
jgi:indolepyruvate ferredoxin oxidoreductase